MTICHIYVRFAITFIITMPHPESYDFLSRHHVNIDK